MKSLLVLIVAVMIAAVSCAQVRTESNKQAIPDKNNGFVVAELFTSEGCSSCPPADKLLEKLQQEDQGKPVYLLAFHVDYWDRLGWKDRFSDPAYTERQRRYAGWLKLETVYTPQMVINGKSESVGSDERSINKAISKGLEQTTSTTLTLHAKTAGGTLQVDYQAANDKHAELVLALVQKSATSNVKAGENAGKQLSHAQIVRQLVQQDVSEAKTITLNLPNDFVANGWELIGFIQQKSNGHITAAAWVEL
ncbi:hypothetical protein A3860_05635 [Niastella vici]|uniref:DUF1223 domain-containing protein n=1 Tax=Niastella vici TaxID=1703345 RepID=A0A1V9FS59_9BACT|nr:DUF1223 domain-containing protein [Niastella vici]OQP61194.1 hypothetical protein A3860_05635 [Niastella vici]